MYFWRLSLLSLCCIALLPGCGCCKKTAQNNQSCCIEETTTTTHTITRGSGPAIALTQAELSEGNEDLK